MILEREYGDIVIRRDGEAVAFCHPVVVPGSVTVPELSLEVETKIYDAGGEVQRWEGVLEKRGLSEENYLWQAVFDYDKIALPLYMRSRRPGDWFRPAGMAGGRKKLQDYFVDEKVPRAKRDTVPVLATDRDVVWVVGMRTDERFLPDEGTKKLLFVSFRRVE
jgi:tRNA(Ile)-lysidine synthase